MITHKTAINFLRHIFYESIADMANISVAEAEDDYDTILQYLESLQDSIRDWIRALKKEKEDKR